jgi:hypothetical protein
VIGGWHSRVSEAVRRLAPASTALYAHDEIPDPSHDALRSFMDDRLAELRDIMGALP